MHPPAPRIAPLRVLIILGLLLTLPLSLIAQPKTPEQISFAALQGRVWVLALVGFLHDSKLSEKDRKAVYSLYLYHELKVAGLDSAQAPGGRAANTQLYERTLGHEFLEKLTATIRVPFEKPYLDNPKLKITAPQQISLQTHFRKLLDPIRPADRDTLPTPGWLTGMELSSVLIKDLKTSLDEWEDGKVVDEDENEKLYETVESDLEKVIDRINDDEDIINEAWKIAVTEWLKE
jgi:hypothetical protein